MFNGLYKCEHHGTLKIHLLCLNLLCVSPLIGSIVGSMGRRLTTKRYKIKTLRKIFGLSFETNRYKLSFLMCSSRQLINYFLVLIIFPICSSIFATSILCTGLPLYLRNELNVGSQVPTYLFLERLTKTKAMAG